MKYIAKLRSGHTVILRCVVTLQFTVDTGILSAVTAGTGPVRLKGVTSFEGQIDNEPWGNSFTIIPPDDGAPAAPAESPDVFRREAEVPAELAQTTFGRLDRLEAMDRAGCLIAAGDIKRRPLRQLVEDGALTAFRVPDVIPLENMV